MTAEGVGALLGGIAALVWPLLLLVGIVVLRRQIRGIADSVGARGGSVKLAGFEVTIAEATEQQQKLIADLQIQLGHLQNRVDGAPPAAAGVPPTEAPAETGTVTGLPEPIPSAANTMVPTDLLGRRTAPRGITIGWVDSNPQTSAALQAALQDWGVTIVNLRSISEALDYAARHRAAVLVSRMTIAGERRAGIDLATRISGAYPFVTLYIFASGANLGTRGHEALAAGAHFVTSSSAELVRKLALLEPESD